MSGQPPTNGTKPVLFDLITSVWNSVYHVRACLQGVFRNSTLPFHLWVVNDGSDAHSTQALRDMLLEYDPAKYTYVENEQNLGYLASINKTIPMGNAPYVVMVNSDTIPLPGYLEKMRAVFELDPAIAVINPVSNWANWTRVCSKIPEGFDIAELAGEIDLLAEKQCPDLYNASGFFFPVRRKVFEELGLFDPVYGFGYYEETDFCFRVIEAGYRVVVDDSWYVFHHGWGSFPGPGRSTEIFKRNKEIFLKRYGKSFESLKRAWTEKEPLAALRARIDGHGGHLWRNREAREACPPSRTDITRENAQRILNEMLDTNIPLGEKTPDRQPTNHTIAREARIIYIMPSLILDGSTVSVLQVVNQLVARGYRANIATYGRVEEGVFRLFPAFFNAYRFADQASLVADFPECELIVATQPDTACCAVLLRRLRPYVNLVHFVQECRSDAYGTEVFPVSLRMRQVCDLIRNKIVRTRRLAGEFADSGMSVDHIPPGINLDFFYDKGERRQAEVLTIARPSSRRFNFPMMKEVCIELHHRKPDLQFALLGEDLEDTHYPFHSYGPLPYMQEVAAALNRATVFLDCSTFKAQGYLALEAMACGTAAVLTHEGGITEHAKHEYNCLLADPYNPEDILNKLVELLDDENKRRRLVNNGFATAEEHSLSIEVERTAALFSRILSNVPAE